MLRSRLAELLAKNNERQDELSEKIGISKTTLSNMVTNRTNGVQYGTLNALAVYFGVEVGDLFEFVPFDIEFSGDDAFLSYKDFTDYTDYVYSNQENFADDHGLSFALVPNVFADVTTPDAVKYRFALDVYVQTRASKQNEESRDTGYKVSDVANFDYFVDFVNENDAFDKYLEQIPKSFKQVLLDDLMSMFNNAIAPLLSDAGLAGKYQIEFNDWTAQTTI